MLKSEDGKENKGVGLRASERERESKRESERANERVREREIV